LSKEQVKNIYFGKIDNWKDVDGPDSQIYVVGREPGSGTRDTFNEIIFGNTTVETLGVDTVALGSAEVKTAIAGSDKGIGYLGFSYAEGEDIRALALDGVFPTVDDIKGRSYQLSRRLYLYSYESPSPGAMSFIEFVQSPTGQEIAQENGFIPAFSVSYEGGDRAENESQNVNESATTDFRQQPGFEAAWALVSILAVLGLISCRRRDGSFFEK
jgi:phosphate transport system substrate-binding protein